jgi:hypothetical protein
MAHPKRKNIEKQEEIKRTHYKSVWNLTILLALLQEKLTHTTELTGMKVNCGHRGQVLIGQLRKEENLA